jgi:hypothetical protein
MNQLPGNKLTDRFYLYLSPFLLLTIASIQFYFAHAYELTPWKGGGFGMFSTVDALDTRFLKIFLITPNGAIPADVPANLEQDKTRIRSLPTPSRIAALAEAMARGTWIDCDIRRREVFAKVTGAPSSDASSPATRSTGKPRMVRQLEPDEVAHSSAEIVEFSSIRVEFWRYRFDPGDAILRAGKVLEVTRPRMLRQGDQRPNKQG